MVHLRIVLHSVCKICLLTRLEEMCVRVCLVSVKALLVRVQLFLWQSSSLYLSRDKFQNCSGSVSVQKCTLQFVD